MTKSFITTSAELGIPKLPEALRGLRICHLSDLHNMRFGETGLDLADAVTAENPDIIFMTGDMCDHHHPDGGEALLQLLTRWAGQFPVYLCPGNHEELFAQNYPEESARVWKRVKELGAVVLEDSCALVTVKEAQFYLCGLSFLRGQSSVHAVRERLGECPKDLPVFVLCHHPKWFDVLEEWGASAVFSGHIHGGLIRLPLLGGLLSPSIRLFPRYDKGIFHLPGAVLHVSAGFGDTAIGFRFRNPREANVLTLGPYREKEKAPRPALKALRIAFGLLFAGLTAVDLCSLVSGVFQIGIVLGFLFFAPPAAALLYPELLLKPLRRRRWRVLRRWLVRLYALGAAVALVISCMMVRAAAEPAPSNLPVIILGCRVRGTEPSLMLQSRIQAALKYLQANPGSIAVASGGQGPGEDIPEALAIKDALVKAGIDPARIWMEDTSKNTRQNLEFSAMLLFGEDPHGDDDSDESHEHIAPPALQDRRVVIATSELHQLRAAVWAKRFGMDAAPLSGFTPWHVFFGQWFREVLGNLRLFLLGY